MGLQVGRIGDPGGLKALTDRIQRGAHATGGGRGPGDGRLIATDGGERTGLLLARDHRCRHRPFCRQCGGIARDLLQQGAEVGDLVEGAVVAGFGQHLKSAAGSHTLRIRIADRVSVEGSENRRNGFVIRRDRVTGVHPHGAAEAVNGVERIVA